MIEVISLLSSPWLQVNKNLNTDLSEVSSERSTSHSRHQHNMIDFRMVVAAIIVEDLSLMSCLVDGFPGVVPVIGIFVT